MKSGWQWKQKDDEFERDFKAELAELEIDCKSMGVNSEPRRHCPSWQQIGDWMVLRKLMLWTNHISRSTPGIDELVSFQQNWSWEWICPPFLYSYQNESTRKAIYAFVVCSNKILTSSSQGKPLKKTLHSFLSERGKKDDASSALKFLYDCHFRAGYNSRFPKEKWIGYITLGSEKGHPYTAIACVSIILIDKPRLRNVYKANYTDSACFSSYLTVHIKGCVYLHGSGMDPKNLKSA